MSDAVGLHSRVAIAYQSARGTATTLGSGHRIPVTALDPPTEHKVTPRKELTGFPAATTVKIERGEKTAKVSGPFYAYKIPELLAGMLGTAAAGTEVNETGAYKRAYTYSRSTAEALSWLYTMAWHALPDDASTFLVEMKDAQIIEFTIKAPEDGECTFDFTLYSETAANWSSAVNTSSSAWTFAWTAATCPAVYHSDDFVNRIWLTTQADGTLSAADALCLTDWTLSFKFGADQKNYDTCGGKAAVPGMWDIELSGKLSAVSDDTYAGWFTNATTSPLKCKIHGLTDTGMGGTSYSAGSPSVDISAGTDTKFKIALDGEAAQEITLVLTGLNSGANIAAAIQTAVRALTAVNTYNQPAYDNFVCNYNSGVASKYFLQSGSYRGANSSCVITDGTSANVADDLKIGVANGGTEAVGVSNAIKFFFPQMRLIDYPPKLSGMGRIQPSVKFAAEYYDSSTSTPGFDADDDTDLGADCVNQVCTIVIIDPQTTAPNA